MRGKGSANLWVAGSAAFAAARPGQAGGRPAGRQADAHTSCRSYPWRPQLRPFHTPFRGGRSGGQASLGAHIPPLSHTRAHWLGGHAHAHSHRRSDLNGRGALHSAGRLTDRPEHLDGVLEHYLSRFLLPATERGCLVRAGPGLNRPLPGAFLWPAFSAPAPRATCAAAAAEERLRARSCVVF